MIGNHEEINSQVKSIQTIIKTIDRGSDSRVYERFVRRKERYGWEEPVTRKRPAKFYEVIVTKVDEYQAKCLLDLGYEVTNFNLEKMSRKTRKKAGYKILNI